MKKKFGQNFLINNDVVNRIINATNIDKNSQILEVGPGNGSLTKEIIKKNPKKFIAIEIDKSLKKNISDLFIKKNYNLLFQDALTFDENKNFSSNYTVISNLPYNISLTLLLKWIGKLNDKYSANRMVLMFQKEVGERILANLNSKKYGRITILCSAFFSINKICDVDKNNFFPIPKVDSTVLAFERLNKFKISFKNLDRLDKISYIFFNNRRKKLKKKIENYFSDSQIHNNNLKKLYDLRVENLSKDFFYNLVENL